MVYNPNNMRKGRIPNGATHYHIRNKFYYMITEAHVWRWCRVVGDWVRSGIGLADVIHQGLIEISLEESIAQWFKENK